MAMAVIPPVETIDLEVPDATVPTTPDDAKALARLKRDYGLGGAVDRLLRVMESLARG
jgi:hypothetical protein